MYDPDEPYRKVKSDLPPSRLQGCIKKLVVGLFGFALLAIGLIATVFAWGLMGQPNEDLEVAIFGSIAFAFLYAGWKSLYAGWGASPGQEENRDEQTQKPAEKEGSGQARDEPTATPVGKRQTGRFALIKGLKRVGPWIGKGLIAWFFLLPIMGVGLVCTLVGLGIMTAAIGAEPTNTAEAAGGGGLALLGTAFLTVGGRAMYKAFRSKEQEDE